MKKTNSEDCCRENTAASLQRIVNSKVFWRVSTLVLAAALLLVAVFDIDVAARLQGNNSTPAAASLSDTNTPSDTADSEAIQLAQLRAAVLPDEGVELPIVWEDIGIRLVSSGAVDRDRLFALYEQRGGLSSKDRLLLEENVSGPLVLTAENSHYLLNVLWAFGLANKNSILETGPMNDPQYGGDPGRFASTGGWTLAQGDPMQHYSKHEFVKLTPAQQALVERVAKNIYRPCCGNSVYFPDCNHGMAMLGLLELMAANGADGAAMYKTALLVNSFWFPETYLTIAKLKLEAGVNWNAVDPKEVLGAAYSSAAGYRQVLSRVEPLPSSGGGGCGV